LLATPFTLTLTPLSNPCHCPPQHSGRTDFFGNHVFYGASWPPSVRVYLSPEYHPHPLVGPHFFVTLVCEYLADLSFSSNPTLLSFWPHVAFHPPNTDACHPQIFPPMTMPAPPPAGAAVVNHDTCSCHRHHASRRLRLRHTLSGLAHHLRFPNHPTPQPVNHDFFLPTRTQPQTWFRPQ